MQKVSAPPLILTSPLDSSTKRPLSVNIAPDAYLDCILCSFHQTRILDSALTRQQCWYYDTVVFRSRDPLYLSTSTKNLFVSFAPPIHTPASIFSRRYPISDPYSGSTQQLLPYDDEATRRLRSPRSRTTQPHDIYHRHIGGPHAGLPTVPSPFTPRSRPLGLQRSGQQATLATRNKTQYKLVAPKPALSIPTRIAPLAVPSRLSAVQTRGSLEAERCRPLTQSRG